MPATIPLPASYVSFRVPSAPTGETQERSDLARAIAFITGIPGILPPAVLPWEMRGVFERLATKTFPRVMDELNEKWAREKANS